MIRVRKSGERGYDDKGWLQTYHAFSFDDYYDPDYLDYRALRVINEDIVKGGKGFSLHTHKEVEILTLVLEGSLEHQDTLGGSGLVMPGDVLCMSAGTGVAHSEHNLSPDLPVHFLQIWLQPDQHNLEPSYQQKTFSGAAKWGRWCLMASRNGRDGSLRVHQDVELYATLLEKGDALRYEALLDRYFWFQILSGKFSIQGTPVERGDALIAEEESVLDVHCLEPGELLLFDLA